jgi:hypothetical protein
MQWGGTPEHHGSPVADHCFMEPEGSSLCSQKPTNGPYLEPGESRSHST